MDNQNPPIQETPPSQVYTAPQPASSTPSPKYFLSNKIILLTVIFLILLGLGGTTYLALNSKPKPQPIVPKVIPSPTPTSTFAPTPAPIVTNAPTVVPTTIINTVAPAVISAPTTVIKAATPTIKAATPTPTCRPRPACMYASKESRCLIEETSDMCLYSVGCAQDTKLCPDGKTYVGRQGPNCEFALCPSN